MAKIRILLLLVHLPLLATVVAVPSRCHAAPAVAGVLEIKVVDSDTGQPIACRMHLKNSRGKPVRPPRSIYWDDHFVVDGSITLKLPKGNYKFEVERGLEYLTQTGHFTINNFANDNKTIELKRFANMAEEGWWSGDLHVRRPVKDLDAIMRAEDLHVVVRATSGAERGAGATADADRKPFESFSDQRFACLFGSATSDAGNSVQVLKLRGEMDVEHLGHRCAPLDQLRLIRSARAEGGWMDVAKPFSWDLPLWLAQQNVDSLEIAHSGLARTKVLDTPRFGYQPDPIRYAGPHGAGRWSHDIYYHLLNSGLRIPPAAGSGSGESPNPTGYNRLYVWTDSDFSAEAWWEGLRAGRVMVTNGPLIRASVEGQPPGHTFEAESDRTIELEIGLTLSTRDKVSYLEIVRDGRVEHDVRLSEWKEQGGRLPKLRFDRSGWFLVRAVTEVQNTYRFATTAPYYVRIGDEPRVSRQSVQFFLDWINERIASVQQEDTSNCSEFLQELEAARDWWTERLAKANAD